MDGEIDREREQIMRGLREERVAIGDRKQRRNGAKDCAVKCCFRFGGGGLFVRGV